MSTTNNTNRALTVHDHNAQLLALDQRVDAAESDAIFARWEFGRLLLAEREAHGGHQLPHGRLDEVCRATGKSRSEIQFRIQFADCYRTQDEVSTGVDTLRSWTAIRKSLGRAADVAIPSQLVEAAAQYERNREVVAAQQRAHDEDVARFGSSPGTPPLTSEGERLCDALRRMTAGATGVSKLVELEPLIPLARLVAELPPASVAAQLRKVRAACDHVALALQMSRPMDVPAPPSGVIEFALDRDADVDATPALRLEGGEDEDAHFEAW